MALPGATDRGAGLLLHTAMGAQILSAQLQQPQQWQLLYLSPRLPQLGAPVRGGVPVLFPQFANHGSLAKHGFARNRSWQLVAEHADAMGATVTYRLDIAQHSETDWPHSAKLTLVAQTSATHFAMELSVLNTGSTAFQWTGGLHPYWQVPDVCTARLMGLDVQEQGLGFDEAGIEQLFPARGQLALVAGTRCLTLTTQGFDEWMVWNPGVGGAAVLTDLPPGDWQRFVCIEPVRVSRPVDLQPGEAFTGTMKAEWIEEGNRP